MASQKRREDRRIQRTRQVLQQAFVDVVREKGKALRSLPEMEKGFAATSIQEITARANVNRGTFTSTLRINICWRMLSSVSGFTSNSQASSLLNLDGTEGPCVCSFRLS